MFAQHFSRHSASNRAACTQRAACSVLRSRSVLPTDQKNSNALACRMSRAKDIYSIIRHSVYVVTMGDHSIRASYIILSCLSISIIITDVAVVILVLAIAATSVITPLKDPSRATALDRNRIAYQLLQHGYWVSWAQCGVAYPRTDLF